MSLNAKRILVTRPHAQSAHLCALINAAGGKAIAYPTMTIEAIPPASCPNTQDYDYVIFISANAVHYASKLIDLGAIQKSACVGARTKDALCEYGIHVDLVPETQFNSQGLLALNELKALQGKHILIVRGQGGKETLKTQLTQRGASVDYFECYRRGIPNIDYQPLRYAFLNGDIDIITSSSTQSLMNLLQICPTALDVPLVSISPDMSKKAKEWGFQGDIIHAQNATDEAIVQALHDFTALKK